MEAPPLSHMFLIHFKDFLLKTSKNFSRSKNIDSFGKRRQQDQNRKIEMTLEQKGFNPEPVTCSLEQWGRIKV